MVVIIGLGNVGTQYSSTYHNVGFMVLDKLANKHGLSFNKKKFSANIAEGVLNGKKFMLLKPTTYMNASGEAVCKVAKMLKLNLSNILVVYDDVDLPVGKLRLREKGSAGTHKGMKSIVEKLGSQDFYRLRVGIGNNDKLDLGDYVLSKIGLDNMNVLTPAFDSAVEIIEEFITNSL